MTLTHIFGAVGVLAAAALVFHAAKEARRIGITRREIECPRLPPAFDGFTILHLSDLHLRRSKSFAKFVADAIRAVEDEVDAVAIAGDTTSRRPGLARFETILGALNESHPGVPVFLTTGNSEMRRWRVGRQVQAVAENAGCRVLRNENAPIDRGDEGRIYIVGVDDPFTRRDDLDTALSGMPRDAFTILLAHSPTIAGKAVAGGVDLVLSGHTHGGQIRLPWIGPVYARMGLNRALSSGLFEGEQLRRGIGRRQGPVGHTKLFVSRGVGASRIPLRLMCPPEMAILRLVEG